MESTISVEGRNLAEVKSMQVSIAPDAPLGVQKVRVTTPSGLSTNPHPFVVGDLPETTETEPNNMRDKANAVVPPLTINGKIDLEGDVDYFTFKAQKEQRLIFEVNSRRLGSMLDSFLTLFDAKGEELMVNDDTTDSEAQIDFTFQDDSDYSIAIRDFNRTFVSRSPLIIQGWGVAGIRFSQSRLVASMDLMDLSGSPFPIYPKIFL